MAKTRREFSSELKRERVALLESSGRPLMQVATEVGISPSMLRNWRAAVGGGGGRDRATPSPGLSPLPSPADQASEITRHAGRWPVRLMCRVLEVSASGYYAWRNRPESARAKANRALLADVRRLHCEHHGRYGSRRMHAALRAEGRLASRGRVERLMRRHGMRALAGRRFSPCTTDSRHYLPVAPDLLQQQFIAAAPNRVWLADITYIATGEGWLYLAAVLDLATRMICPMSARTRLLVTP